MFASFYNLSGLPFQLSPDHRFYYGSKSHKKALAYLTYGLSQAEGFIIITGEVGAGKTTLVQHLLTQLDPNEIVAATVVTSRLQADDTIRMIAAEYGVAHQGVDKATLLKGIESFLVANRRTGKRNLLVIDEVQNMPTQSLEELRMLSNFQIGEKPLLQTFLVGQPEFRKVVASDVFEQLRQRVIAATHLKPMEADETRGYIEHRMRLVGWRNDPSVEPEAFKRVHKYTGGIPRKVNTFFSRVLLFGYLEELHHITADAIEEVVEGLMLEGTQLPLPAEELPPTLAPESNVTTLKAAAAAKTEVDERARGNPAT
jgi:putative secretion ATPase (PEP-CTERM system associated)